MSIGRTRNIVQETQEKTAPNREEKERQFRTFEVEHPETGERLRVQWGEDRDPTDADISYIFHQARTERQRETERQAELEARRAEAPMGPPAPGLPDVSPEEIERHARPVQRAEEQEEVADLFRPLSERPMYQIRPETVEPSTLLYGRTGLRTTAPPRVRPLSEEEHSRIERVYTRLEQLQDSPGWQEFRETLDSYDEEISDMPSFQQYMSDFNAFSQVHDKEFRVVQLREQAEQLEGEERRAVLSEAVQLAQELTPERMEDFEQRMEHFRSMQEDPEVQRGIQLLDERRELIEANQPMIEEYQTAVDELGEIDNEKLMQFELTGERLQMALEPMRQKLEERRERFHEEHPEAMPVSVELAIRTGRRTDPETRQRRRQLDFAERFLNIAEIEGDARGGIQMLAERPHEIVPFLRSLGGWVENNDVNQVLIKKDDGERLTPDEQLLHDSWQISQHAWQVKPRDFTHDFTYGLFASLPWMAEMYALSPVRLGVKGLVEGGVTGMQNLARAGFVKNTVASRLVGLVGLDKAARMKALREMAKTTPDMASVQRQVLGSLAGTVSQATAGGVFATGDEFSRLLSMGESPGDAFMKAYLLVLAEHAGQLSGGPMRDWHRALRLRAFGKWAEKQTSTSAVARAWKNIERRSAWHGFWPEFAEEEVIEIFHSAIENRPYHLPFITPEGMDRALMQGSVLGTIQAGFSGIPRIGNYVTSANRARQRRMALGREPEGSIIREFQPVMVSERIAELESRLDDPQLDVFEKEYLQKELNNLRKVKDKQTWILDQEYAENVLKQLSSRQVTNQTVAERIAELEKRLEAPSLQEEVKLQAELELESLREIEDKSITLAETNLGYYYQPTQHSTPEFNLVQIAQDAHAQDVANKIMMERLRQEEQKKQEREQLLADTPEAVVHEADNMPIEPDMTRMAEDLYESGYDGEFLAERLSTPDGRTWIRNEWRMWAELPSPNVMLSNGMTVGQVLMFNQIDQMRIIRDELTWLDREQLEAYRQHLKDNPDEISAIEQVQQPVRKEGVTRPPTDADLQQRQQEAQERLNQIEQAEDIVVDENTGEILEAPGKSEAELEQLQDTIEANIKQIEQKYNLRYDPVQQEFVPIVQSVDQIRVPSKEEVKKARRRFNRLLRKLRKQFPGELERLRREAKQLQKEWEQDIERRYTQREIEEILEAADNVGLPESFREQLLVRLEDAGRLDYYGLNLRSPDATDGQIVRAAIEADVLFRAEAVEGPDAPPEVRGERQEQAVAQAEQRADRERLTQRLAQLEQQIEREDLTDSQRRSIEREMADIRRRLGEPEIAPEVAPEPEAEAVAEQVQAAVGISRKIMRNNDRFETEELTSDQLESLQRETSQLIRSFRVSVQQVNQGEAPEIRPGDRVATVEGVGEVLSVEPADGTANVQLENQNQVDDSMRDMIVVERRRRPRPEAEVQPDLTGEATQSEVEQAKEGVQIFPGEANRIYRAETEEGGAMGVEITSPTTVTITSAHVPPQMRRRGIYTRMMQSLLDRVKQDHPGIRHVEGEVLSREARLARERFPSTEQIGTSPEGNAILRTDINEMIGRTPRAEMQNLADNVEPENPAGLSSQQVAEIEQAGNQIVEGIKNNSKRSYAEKYLNYVLGRGPNPSVPPGVSITVAQNLQEQIRNLLPEAARPSQTPSELTDQSQGHGPPILNILKGPAPGLTNQQYQILVRILQTVAGDITTMRADQINLDPDRFQFKLLVDEKGVSQKLKNVKQFDPKLGGIIMAWRDPADNKIYVVNGHHRVELAQRTQYKEEIPVLLIQAETAGEARVDGALVNVAEGQGDAIDAAKLFRDTGLSKEELSDRGIALSERLVRDGLALANLHNSIFGMVSRGQFPIERATIIGRKLADQDMQLQVIQLIDRYVKKGRKITNDLVSEIVDEVVGAPSKQVTQETLFGEDVREQSLALERAKVKSYIRNRLSKEKRLFGVVSNSKNAELLSKGENVINIQQSENISKEAAMLLEFFDRFKNVAPVSGIINQAVKRIDEGENASRVQEETFDRIREVIPQIIEGAEGSNLAESPQSVREPESGVDVQLAFEQKTRAEEAAAVIRDMREEHERISNQEVVERERGNDARADELQVQRENLEGKMREYIADNEVVVMDNGQHISLQQYLTDSGAAQSVTDKKMIENMNIPDPSQPPKPQHVPVEIETQFGPKEKYVESVTEVDGIQFGDVVDTHGGVTYRNLYYFHGGSWKFLDFHRDGAKFTRQELKKFADRINEAGGQDLFVGIGLGAEIGAMAQGLMNFFQSNPLPADGITMSDNEFRSSIRRLWQAQTGPGKIIRMLATPLWVAEKYPGFGDLIENGKITKKGVWGNIDRYLVREMRRILRDIEVDILNNYKDLDALNTLERERVMEAMRELNEIVPIERELTEKELRQKYDFSDKAMLAYMQIRSAYDAGLQLQRKLDRYKIVVQSHFQKESDDFKKINMDRVRAHNYHGEKMTEEQMRMVDGILRQEDALTRKQMNLLWQFIPVREALADVLINEKYAPQYVANYVSLTRPQDHRYYVIAQNYFASFPTHSQAKADAQRQRELGREPARGERTILLIDSMNDPLPDHVVPQLSESQIYELSESAGVNARHPVIQQMVTEIRGRGFTKHHIKRQRIPGFKWNWENVTKNLEEYFKQSARRYTKHLAIAEAQQIINEEKKKRTGKYIKIYDPAQNKMIEGRVKKYDRDGRIEEFTDERGRLHKDLTEQQKESVLEQTNLMPPHILRYAEAYLQSLQVANPVQLEVIRQGIYTATLGLSMSNFIQNLTQSIQATWNEIPILLRQAGVKTPFLTEKIFGEAYLMAVKFNLNKVGKKMNLGKVKMPKEFAELAEVGRREGILNPLHLEALIAMGFDPAEKYPTGSAQMRPVKRFWNYYTQVMASGQKMSEVINRDHAYFTGMIIGKNHFNLKGRDLHEFAVRVVQRTQFTFGKHNTPFAITGLYGSTPANYAQAYARVGFLLRGFSWNYMGRIADVARSQVPGSIGRMIVGISTIAGLRGLPHVGLFYALYNFVNYVAMRLGLSDDPEPAELKERKIFGEIERRYGLPHRFLTTGPIGSALGVETHRLVGSGYLLPTRMRMSDIYGVGANMMRRTTETVDAVVRGDAMRALRNMPINPRFVSNLMREHELMTEGVISSGRVLVPPEELTQSDRVKLMMGFSPTKAIDAYERSRIIREISNMARSQYNVFLDQYVRAIARDDRDAQRNIEQSIDEWNARFSENPEMQIDVRRFRRDVRSRTTGRTGRRWRDRIYELEEIYP